MEGKSVTITGGFGFLGSNLAKRLVDTNNDVTLVVSSERSRKNVSDIEKKVEIVNMKINSDSDFANLINGKDYFFHFAWQNDLERSMLSPLEDIYNDLGGMIRLLEDCRNKKTNMKIIFPSTVTVAGNEQKVPANENEMPNPSSIYDANKLAAESYLRVYFRNFGVDFTTLRLSNVYGERQRIDNPRRGVVNFMVGRALNGQEMTIHGDGSFIRDYSYVGDFIEAFLLAAESKSTSGETYILGSNQGRAFTEVVSQIQKSVKQLTGIDSYSVNVPFPEEAHGINKRNFIADSTKFFRATGWSPKTSFEEGIRRTVNFYKNE